MKKFRRGLALCLVLMLILMLNTALMQNSSFVDVAGNWVGGGMGSGMDVALSIKGAEGGTLRLMIGDKTDIGDLKFDKQGRTFSVTFPKGNQVNVKSCSGMMMSMGTGLTLSLTLQFQDGSMKMPLFICERDTKEERGPTEQASAQQKSADTKGYIIRKWNMQIDIPAYLGDLMQGSPPEHMGSFSFLTDSLPQEQLFTMMGWREKKSGPSDLIGISAYHTPEGAEAGNETTKEAAAQYLSKQFSGDDTGRFVKGKVDVQLVGSHMVTAFPVDLFMSDRKVASGWIMLLPLKDNTMVLLGLTDKPQQSDMKQMLSDALDTLKIL